MAKTLLSVVFFALVAPLVLSDAAALRSNVTYNSNTTRPRALQEDCSVNAALLNDLINLALPTINDAIQQYAPDPLELNLAGTINAGFLDILGCSLSTDLTYNFGGISGLSGIFIETLEVIPGTESISAGCSTTLWSGAFNVVIASLSSLSLNDLGANWIANACGLAISPGVGGNIVTNNPYIGGTIDLAGEVCGAALNINFAQVIDSLTISYSSVEASLDNIPPFLGDVVTTATRELSILLQNELINQVEPAIRPVIEEQLVSAQFFSPTRVIPIQMGFLRNGMIQGMQSLVNETASFLGFGGSD
ncbi:expressed unknown protein [Seminavis robusta]|uniref:Uncharacterized protein n=1 Tax=Seminavis robusta TaxID=568900 RepID=A0A9N8EES4_9STRA|nr:expressed unknown protein [Seminavis robusta]|eukprot:Sro1018_g231860.1 n/a (306) ;mRNA; r:23576-24687